jgi:Uma2 family endonuclease
MKDDGRMTHARKRGPAVEQPKQSFFTADEFIAWALQQPTGRFELESGAVVAMAPERADHATAKGNAFMALRSAIRARGLICQAFPDGMSVRINDRTVYEPDALVRCGPHLPGDAIEANDPVIIVEVVSPSSRGVDRGVKLAGYFSLPSVRHYLIVDVDKRVVIHHRRDEQGRIAAEILSDGPLTLDPPGFGIDIRDIFDGI